MVEVGRRERKKQQTRAALEQAAFALFLERGYDATTVEDIADAADVSARTFFRYFVTKDDVLVSDHVGRLEALSELLAERPAGEPIMDSIEAALRFLAADIARDPQRVLVQNKVSGERVHVLGVFRQHHSELADVISAFIHRRSPEPDPFEVRSRTIAAGAIGAFLAASRAWAKGGATDDLQSFMDEALGSLRTVVHVGA